MADSQVTLHQLLHSRRCLLRVLKQNTPSDHPLELDKFPLDHKLSQFRSIIALQQKRMVRAAFIDHIRSQYPNELIHTVKNNALSPSDIHEGFYLNLEFSSQSIRAQLDAALCDRHNQWHLFLLKSGTGVKQNDFIEAAFTLILFEHLGFTVNQFSVCVVKRKYVGEPKNCIDLIPVIDELREYQADFNEQLTSLKENYFSNLDRPLDLIEATLTRACFKPSRCQYFSDCWPEVTDRSIFTIAHLHPDKKQELVSNGIVDINDITELSTFTPNQQRYIQLVQTQSAHADWKRITERLSNLTWPIYFLDFEADNPSISSYPNTPTFAKIVFQFSCHKANTLADLVSGNFEHHYYVHCDDSDPRPAVIQNLQQCIGEAGSIVVWHADFERSRLLEMAALQPDHSEALVDFVDRLWDLELIFIHNFDDYRANGSKSLKSIYPMIQSRASDLLNNALVDKNKELKLALNRIVTGMDYSGLDINDGEQVMAAWYLLKATCDKAEKAKLIELMQGYCLLDTLALADIVLYLLIMIDLKQGH